jgi:hypothetical protein
MLAKIKITGNEKTDQAIRLGIFAAGVFGIYRLIKKYGQSPVNPNQIELPQGCYINMFRQSSIKTEMDTIYDLMTGWNFFMYPDEVNVILGYNLCELQFANIYFLTTYNTTLYKIISEEWDYPFYYYAAALNKLRQNGLGN